MNTYLALDYDNTPITSIKRDINRINEILACRLHFSIRRSSIRSYHALSMKPIDYVLARFILELSNCSEGYKAFVRKQGKFYVRTGDKVKFYRENGKLKRRVKQEPKFVCVYP